MKLVERLAVALELTIGTSTFEVAAGNIKGLQLELYSYGFRAALDFWIVCYTAASEDTLYDDFVKSDFTTAKLTVDRVFDEVGQSAGTLTLKGVVTARSFSEQPLEGVAGAPVFSRHYRVTITDRAAALWSQHRPVELFVDKSYKQVIDAHKPPGLTLTHAWSAASTTHSIVSLSLGLEGSRASFYDYLLWLLDQCHAGLLYDYGNDAYTISDSKKSFGDAQSLQTGDVGELRAVFPSVPRASVSVLNANAEASTKKKDVANAQKVSGLHRDVLIRSAVAKHLDERATLEITRAKLPRPQVRLELAQYPSTTFRPNVLFDFSEWPSTLFQSGTSHRMCELRIAGRAESQVAADADGAESNTYELEVSARLEQASEPHFEHPAFVAPVWPVRVEGKIVSEVGGSDEGTYQVYADSATSADLYKVTIPLWNDQKVIVQYNPSLQGGQLYFPAYRDARVVVALHHHQAFIDRFLDYRPGARLPQDTQGNQILFGKKAKNETSIRHVYKDAKPIFTIVRTLDKDQQTIEVSDGYVKLETKET